MMNTVNPTPSEAKGTGTSFTLQQTLVGMEMNEVDQAILNYLNFLSENISIIQPTFFHVLPKYTSLDPFFEWDDKNYVRDEVLDKSVQNKMEENANTSLASVHSIQPNYRLAHGDVYASYMEALKELKPELLIMGKKSGSNYHSTLAKNILRNSDCDLLLIPSASKCQLKRIVVPIDFSENSGRALQTAVKLNNSLKEKAQVVCLHVYENPEVNMYKISRSYKQYESIIKENIRDAFASFLQKYIPANQDDVKIDFVKKDVPGYGRYIMKYAKTHETDLLVMGTTGHSKAHYVFLGSTTEKILAIDEGIPVMVVK